MRVLLWVAACGLSLGATAGVQLPPATQMQEIQERVNKLAQSEAEKLRDRVRATTLGTLNAETNLEVRKWDEAIRLWKLEKGAGAAPLLAEGVLFDCLGRLQGVRTRVLSSERAVPYFADLALKRPSRAAKAFDDALKIDPALVEARMRAARIRAPKDAQAARELERLAADPTATPFQYLAAISRAEAARSQGDVAGAIRWYDRALVMEPRSTAAAVALSSLKPAAPLPFDELASDDLYYSYPCTILTPGVEAALSARVRTVILSNVIRK